MLDLYGLLQEWLMQSIVLPILYAFDGMGYADDAINALDWFLLGLAQVFLIAFVLRPLEAKDPNWISSSNRKAIGVDIFYTLIHRLGLVQLIIFFAFSPVFFWLESELHDLRFVRWNVESWWPGVTSIPIVSFVIYLVVLDFGEYIYHRASHRFNWWWQLHALHHTQRYMTSWTDNRNNFLDDIGHSAVFSLLALMIGVEPIEFLWLVVVSQFIQSWQHGNFSTDLGIAKYFLISPRFHRLHHAIGIGHDAPGKPGVLGGCNFGILFPWWDMLFGTAIFTKQVYPTGVTDLVPSNNILTQQWQGFKHSMNCLFRKG